LLPSSSRFYGARKTTEADALTVRLGATPISDPPPSSPIFMPHALPVATLPIDPGLGQTPNMLDCITGAVSSRQIINQQYISIGVTVTFKNVQLNNAILNNVTNEKVQN